MNLDDIFTESNFEVSGEAPPASVVRFSPISPDGDIGFPPTLPIELALRTAPVEDILSAYGISQDRFFQISLNPMFVQAVKAANDALQEDGAAFKFKAKLQAEEMLKTSWRLVHDPETPSSVRADLIKSTVRWAEYEPEKKSVANQGNGSSQTLNIQINLA